MEVMTALRGRGGVMLVEGWKLSVVDEEQRLPLEESPWFI